MSYESDNESIASAVVTTNTLLGYVDVEISKEEPVYPKDSFIGGQPIPIDVNSPIPSKFVHCKVCSKPMRLLTQCSADLPGTWYDRALYVFICVESSCRRKDGSIRAIRGIKKDKLIMEQRESEEKKKVEEEKIKQQKIAEKEEETKNLVKNLFGSNNNQNSNPFGANPFGSSTNNPFSKNVFETNNLKKEVNDINSETKIPTFSEVAKSNIKPKDKIKVEKKDVNYKLPEFKGFILYFETEKLDSSKQVLAPLPDNLKIDDEGTIIEDSTSSDNVKSANLPKINPEKNKETEDLAKLFDDQTFQNFTRVLSYNTTQVVRYEPGGSPILYSSKDKVSNIFYEGNGKLKKQSEWNIPSPDYNPSGHRHFELQLMPKMIIDLERDINDITHIMKNGMEWGTIIVATDSEDVVPLNWMDENGVAYIEEWCGVQWEEEIRA